MTDNPLLASAHRPEDRTRRNGSTGQNPNNHRFAISTRKRYDFTMTDLGFPIPSTLQSWIDQRVAEGRYSDAGDYLRDLIRRDQEAAADDAAWVRAMVDEGLASGVIEAEPDAIIEDIIRERRARRG